MTNELQTSTADGAEVVEDLGVVEDPSAPPGTPPNASPDTAADPPPGATVTDAGSDPDGSIDGGAPSRRILRGRTRREARDAQPVFTMPPRLSPVWRWVLGVVLVVQVAVIAGTAVFGAFKLPYFSPIDEAAHYSYIQQIAEHGTLPVLGKTDTSLQALAIERHTYPRLIPLSAQPGLSKLSYEAFQPPLYYIAAAPAFLVTSDYVDKIYAVRLFDVLLLLATVALAGRLARVVLKDRWLLGWSMIMVFLALPGVVVRFVFISNLALAVPLALLFVSELWVAWQRHSGRRLAVAGGILGLCVLTELELVALIPVFVLVVAVEAHRRWSRGTWHLLLVSMAVPFVVMAPWFVFNQVTYHMLTAGPLAIAEQASTVNPHHLHYSIGQLPNTTATLLDPVLPVEWGTSLASQPALAYLDQLLAVLVIPAALVLIAGTGRRLWSMKSAVLGLPWVLNIVEMWYIKFGQQWQVDVRYTYATVPVLLTLAADATDTLRSRYLPVLVTAAATASTVALWAYFFISYHSQYAFH